MVDETEKLVKELDVRIPSAYAPIHALSGGQRQGVAIARATHWATKLVYRKIGRVMNFNNDQAGRALNDHFNLHLQRVNTKIY